MKNIYITIATGVTLFVLGVIMGWQWHKSTIKPDYYEPSKPDTVYVTEWKTKTQYKTQYIEKEIQVIKWQTIKQPVFVYTIIDTVINNIYKQQNFLKQNNVESQVVKNISFDVEVRTNIKTYADTTFNQSYLKFNQSMRVKNFIIEPAPLLVKYRDVYKQDKFQLYGNLGFTYQQQKNTIYTPYLSMIGVIKQRINIDVGIAPNSYYIGAGARLFRIK